MDRPLTSLDISWTSQPLPKSLPDLRSLTDLEILVSRESHEWAAPCIYDLLIESRDLRELLAVSQALTIDARLQVERYRQRVASLIGEIRQFMGIEPDGR